MSIYLSFYKINPLSYRKKCLMETFYLSFI